MAPTNGRPQYSNEATFPSPVKTWRTKSYKAIDPTQPALSTQGKNIVVTGGGTGVGKEIARSFVKSGASHLALLGRRRQPLEETKAEIQSLGSGKTNIHVIIADVTSPESIKAALHEFLSSIGQDAKIDILVANAGVVSENCPIAKIDPAAFSHTVGTNYLGNVNLLQAFVPLAADDAGVLHVSSAAGHLPPVAGSSPYAASKAASTMLFQYFQVENPGFTVVSIHPGAVMSEMVEATIETFPEFIDIVDWVEGKCLS